MIFQIERESSKGVLIDYTLSVISKIHLIFLLPSNSDLIESGKWNDDDSFIGPELIRWLDNWVGK